MTDRTDHLPAHAELVIVGGGIMGLAIAYYAAKAGLSDVVVIERGYLAGGASGRNGGGVRQQWATEINIRLMQESVALCKEFSVELGVNVWFRQGGYLFLARTARDVARLEQNIALQNRCGVATRMVDPRKAQQLVPELNIDGVVGAAYNPTDGILFPWPFLWGYRDGATRLGARVYTHTEVRGMESELGGIRVHTSRGQILARRMVNAAGAWSPQLANMLGLTLPTFPILHEICVTEPLKPFLGPMVSELATGLYCSQSMRGELVGGINIPGHGEPLRLDTPGPMPTTPGFLPTYARRMTKLFPSLNALKIIRHWSGPYDGSPDGNPLVGPYPDHPNAFLACGFVGHGFMMAPIVGKLYGQWLARGEPHEFFERFSMARFRDPSLSAPREDFNIG